MVAKLQGLPGRSRGQDLSDKIQKLQESGGLKVQSPQYSRTNRSSEPALQRRRRGHPEQDGAADAHERAQSHHEAGDAAAGLQEYIALSVITSVLVTWS